MRFTPTLNILLEDTDVTSLRVQGSGISIQKSLGYPQLLASKGNFFSFVLDNSDGDFDFNVPDNFFVRRGLPSNGRGAKVLIKVSQHTEPATVIFAGFVVDVRSNLNDTSVILEVNDIVSSVFQSEPATLGQTIRRTITDYEGASDDYAEDNYAFRFPEHGIPIQRGSVRVIAPTGVQIVDAINIIGALSNRRAEIDYVNSVIRFEDAPANGVNEEITIEWRIDYRFVRPDVLVRLLLEAGGLHQKLQLTDALPAAYAIERAQLETPLPSFSSHGSPYFDRIGVTRWMEWDQNEQKLYFVSDNRLIEYDDATSEQTFITTLPDTEIDGYETTVAYHFFTNDFDTFFFLTANTAKGDVRQDTAITRNKIEKYVRSSNTWTTLLHSTNGEPQLAHPFDFQNSIAYYADNSKTGLHVAFRNNNTFVFYRRVQANSASIAYSNETGGGITNIHTESWSGDHQGLPYSMDFVIDRRDDGIYCYSFVVRYTSSSATLKIFRRRVDPSAAEAEIFSETFARTGGTDEYPISVSGIVLADDRSKFYFVLSYVSEALNDYGKAELCCVNKDGSGGRMVIKPYPNPLLAARSACEVNARYYYFEGGWVRRPKTSTDDDVPDEEHYYPNAGGNLIEILSDGSIADHGTAPRRFDIFDSPDASDLIYEGWGLFNACTSNIACNHQEDTLHLIAGFGVSVRVDDNLPTQAVADYIADVNNFAWIQYGEKLSTKLDSYRTEDRRVWDMIVELANVVDYEVGFGPSPEAVAVGRSTFPALTEFQANATVYFRPRTIQPAVLRSDISAVAANIDLDDATLQEFPSGSNEVVVGNELIRYTASAEDGDGVSLSGLTRGLFGSAAVDHDADEKVYFVDYFVSSEHENVLVTVTDRQLDYGNIKNIIKMEYGANIYEQRDRASVIQNGGRTLDLPRVLSATDLTWAEEMVNRYIREKDAQTLITYVDKINPKLSLSQSVVMHLHRRAKTDYQLFKVVRVTHDMSSWQTQAVIRSIGELRTAQPVAASIIAISGGGQSAPIGQTLNNSLIVQVNDQNGNPLGDVSVFAQTSDGSLNTESAITDGAGQASFSLTLPNTLGAVTVTMNVPGVSAAARFIATATQAPLFASAITLISGNNQVGKPNTALAQPFVVQVNDQNGNPLLGASVTFSVITGNGLPSPLTVLTDGSGRAQTTYTFGSGTMATETIRAEAAGLTASVTFSAVLQAASSVSVRSGNNQEILVSTSLSAFSVVVRDQANAGVSGIDVNWAIITGTGTLSVTTSTTNSSGVASAVFTATAAGAISVRASVNNVAQNAVFSANVYTYGQELTSERVDFDASMNRGVIHNNFPPITLFAGRSSGRLRVFNTSGEILRTSDSAIPNGPLLHSSSSSVLILNNSTERIETWDTGSMTELTNSRVTLEVPSGQAILTIFGAGWDFNKTNILLSHLGDDPDTIFLEQKLSEVNTFTGSLQSTRPFDAFDFIEEAPNGILYTDSGEPTSSNRIRAYRKSDLVRISSLDINPSFGVTDVNYFNKRLYLFAGSSVRVLFIG